MDYRTGIRAIRALVDGVPEFISAVESSPDFEPEEFATLARLGNVREWLAPVVRHARAWALLTPTFVSELADLAEAQAEKKRALLELGMAVHTSHQDAGIPVLFLKGLYVGERFYGDICRRHQYDLDVLVPPPHFERAVEVLGTLGFDIREDRAARRLQKIRQRDARRAPQTITVRRPDGLVIDLHCRTKSRMFPGLREETLWGDRKEVTVGGWSFDTLSDLHTLLLQSVSLCLDFRRSAGRVKHFLDLYLMLRALHDDVEWESYLTEREREGLLAPLATVWTMLLSLWDCAGEFPALAGALGGHRSAVELRDPMEALRIVSRPRGSLANRAWFLSIRRPATLDEWSRALTVYGPHLVWRALRPRDRLEAWPWNEAANERGARRDPVTHVR